MSTDFSIKPVGIPAATPIIAPLAEAAKRAVATELPASQSVTAADATVRARNDSSSVGSASVSHQVIFDRAASAVVYQVVDGRTNQVVDQFPDQGFLRRRAYARALDLAKSAPTRHLVTERSA
jgi:hypothetical protein